MMRKQLICYLLMTLLVVPMIWSQERAIRPANQQSNADVRQALVIGNSAYTSAGMLRNPVNDARAISNTLSGLGFAVTTITNADQREMEQSIRDFGKQLRDRKGVGLFYYAGHGMQFDGENYLLPVDINPSTEMDVRYDAVPLGKMLGQMQNAGNRINVVVIDACRNNPFARSFRTFNPGLAQVTAPEGTFISFATAPGKIAADGDGRNGLFTSKLLQHLRTPGLKIEEVFKRTAADVYRASNKQQVPWVQYAVIGDFYFNLVALPPQKLSPINLSDLVERTDEGQGLKGEQTEQQEILRKWQDWQRQMQIDYEKVLTFEKRATDLQLKIESWQRFLSQWVEENPYSQQDSDLRSKALKRLKNWQMQMSDSSNKSTAGDSNVLPSIESQWSEWQKMMNLDFNQNKAGNQSKEFWESFLANWGDENPYSDQDNRIRFSVKARLRNITESESSMGRTNLSKSSLTEGSPQSASLREGVRNSKADINEAREASRKAYIEAMKANNRLNKIIRMIQYGYSKARMEEDLGESMSDYDYESYRDLYGDECYALGGKCFSSEENE
mgnify:CR=1 FL=1